MNLEALLGRVSCVARSGGKAVLAWSPRMSHPATGYLLVIMVLGGIVLRIQNVGYPFHWGFDEQQFVSAARQFLICLPDTGECCHPPLSKLLVAVGILLFGDNPMGWRFMALCLGIQSIVLVFLIAGSLFKDLRAGWLAAAFMAADGFCLAFSRDTFPEGMMTCLVLWSMLAAVTARGWGGVLTCAVLVGLAGSIKWSGLVVGLPACVAILMLKRAPWYSLASFAVVPIVHVAIWMVGLALIGHPYDPMSVWEEIQRRKGLHLAFPHGANPSESAWYTWFIAYHPIVVKSLRSGSTVRLASSVANPLLLFTADLVLLVLPVAAAAWALRIRSWRERWSRLFDADANKALVILWVAWLSMLLLWISGRIVEYWYHYLTPWGLAIPLMAGVFARLDRRFPKTVLVFVVLVLALFVYFAPVWAEIPISTGAAHRRLIFPLWR
ncbi:MAG: glycosyltransferase family 39 protein [Polyangiaceae bacterium]|nr:glycosyltransferase family 39 protein [Polyangiaceae bacterium]